jgi:ribonuclease P protein component
MPAKSSTSLRKRVAREAWLRKHADYQRVYREGKRQSLPLMTYFFALRTSPEADSQLNSRIGLTAGRVLGNAVERNRIKRRMREAVRRHRMELTASVDVILHPRRTVLEAEFAQIEREVLRALRAVQAAVSTGPGVLVQSSPEHSKSASVAGIR